MLFLNVDMILLPSYPYGFAQGLGFIEGLPGRTYCSRMHNLEEVRFQVKS
jgi:hypothetical protein